MAKKIKPRTELNDALDEIKEITKELTKLLKEASKVGREKNQDLLKEATKLQKSWSNSVDKYWKLYHKRYDKK